MHLALAGHSRTANDPGPFRQDLTVADCPVLPVMAIEKKIDQKTADHYLKYAAALRRAARNCVMGRLRTVAF